MKNKNLEVWASSPCKDFRYCELAKGEKKPIHQDWQIYTKSFEKVLNAHKNKQTNIGLVLGSISGVMDIDCDSHEAVTITKHLVGGYLGYFTRCEDSAHYLFLCEQGGKTVRLSDPEGRTLVELRGNGGQTMVPPSIHPDGQHLAYAELCDEAPFQDYDRLYKQVHLIGAASLLLRNWSKGSRHHLSLWLAGLSQSIGMTLGDTCKFVELLCAAAADEEMEDRLGNVKRTFGRTSSLNAGFSGLEELLGKATATKITDWLRQGYGLVPARMPLAANNNALMSVDVITRPEHVTEATLARVLSARLHDKARYCSQDKYWYLWDSLRWKKDEQNQISLMVETFVRELAKHLIEQGETDSAKRVMGFLSLQKLTNLEKLAQREVPIKLIHFDTQQMQFCVRNGVVDLENGNLMASSPSMKHSKVAGTTYDPNAKCPRFIQFLDDIFPNDKELVKYVQKVAGYTLTGSITEQCLFMLLGGGANGKSTLVNVLIKMMGDYATNTAASTLMASNQNHLGDDLVRLAGARLITAAEFEHGQRFAEARVKSLTGGDVISARPLYGRFVDFYPNGKIWLTTNNRPEIRGSDDGIWRRIRELPFNRNFSEHEQVKELLATLVEELPGILNWAVKGCLLWQSEGLHAPDSVTESVREYRSEMDTVIPFIEDECRMDQSLKVSVTSLYEHYVSWCKLQDRHPRTKVQFGKDLTSKGYEQTRDGTGRYWQGLTTNFYIVS
jgi:putative DNA primase/helicase